MFRKKVSVDERTNEACSFIHTANVSSVRTKKWKKAMGTLLEASEDLRSADLISKVYKASRRAFQVSLAHELGSANADTEIFRYQLGKMTEATQAERQFRAILENLLKNTHFNLRDMIQFYRISQRSLANSDVDLSLALVKLDVPAERRHTYFPEDTLMVELSPAAFVNRARKDGITGPELLTTDELITEILSS